MFKFQDEQSTVLGICVEPPMVVGRNAELDYRPAATVRRATELLSSNHFDLLLIGNSLPDVGLWDFLRQLKTKWPRQKWGIVAPQMTEQQTKTAQLFGAAFVFEATPSTEQLLYITAQLRQQAVEQVLNGQFDSPAKSTAARKRSAAS